MPDPDAAAAKTLARRHAAQQYGGRDRGRGPHPLPLFWQMATSETAGDPARLNRIIAAVKRYQNADFRRSMPPVPAVAEAGTARLLDHGGDGPAVLFVPSLVNPSSVLDLSEDRSLLRWLACQGLHVFCIDWGRPGAEERGFNLGDYVERRLMPLAEAAGPVTLAGYCLGGTMAIAAAARGAAERLVTLAAPWAFDGYAPERRAALAGYWRDVEPVARSLGAMPMDLLQPMFWTLDPGLPVRKYERFAAMPPGSAEEERFIALEDWANDGAPIALPALEQCLAGFFGEDLTGRGDWRVGGRAILPADISVPWLNIASAADAIVPAASAPPAPDTRTIGPGHVGMIVGSDACGALWEPLREWLRG